VALCVRTANEFEGVQGETRISKKAPCYIKILKLWVGVCIGLLCVGWASKSFLDAHWQFQKGAKQNQNLKRVLCVGAKQNLSAVCG
tara:strand:+ start:6471 stop:6728 length:258 start_codon:yes stop_codon:yes gene_type:complete